MFPALIRKAYVSNLASVAGAIINVALNDPQRLKKILTSPRQKRSEQCSTLDKEYIQQLGSEQLHQVFHLWSQEPKNNIDPEYWKSRCELPNAL